jgi:hypothetical protein
MEPGTGDGYSAGISRDSGFGQNDMALQEFRGVRWILPGRGRNLSVWAASLRLFQEG